MLLQSEVAISFALGVNDATAPSEYQPQEVARLINGRVSRQGNSIKRRGAGRSPHASASSSQSPVSAAVPVDGGIEYTTAAGVQQVVIFTNGKMFTSLDEGATWTQQATGLSAGKWSHVIIREGSANVLCCANGGTNSYQWDGTTWGTISNIPNNVKYLAVFGDRLVAAGHSGVDVVASKVGDIDNGYGVTAGGWAVKATTHDGDVAVTGLHQLGTVLMVFKRKSVGYIEGFGYQTLQVEAGARGISRSSGCVAFRTIQRVGDSGVMWLSENGFEYFEVGGRVTLVSDRMQSFVNSILMDVVLDNPGLPCALWWPREREYWCAVPAGTYLDANGAAMNNHIFVFRPPTAEGPAAMWLLNWSMLSSSGSEYYVDTSAASDLLPVSAGNGVGSLLLDSDLESWRQFTLVGGRLAITEGNEYGVSGFLEDGRLWLATPGGGLCLGPTTLFTADRAGEVAAPWSGTSGGEVWYHELPQDKDGGSVVDVDMILRLRPLLFGSHFHSKKAKRLQVQSVQSVAGTIMAKVYADGVAGNAKTLSFAASTNRAAEGTARVGGRGAVIDVELRTDDLLEIVAVAVDAQMLDDRR